MARTAWYGTTVLVTLIGLLFFALQVPPVGRWFARALLTQMLALPRAAVTVDRVHGNWVTGLEMCAIRVARQDTVLVVADVIRIRPELWDLLKGRISVAEVEIDGVHAAPTLAADFFPPRLGMARGAAGPAGSLPLRVGSIRLTRGSIEPLGGDGSPALRVAGISLHLRDLDLAAEPSFRLDSLSLLWYGREGPKEPIRVWAGGSLREGRFSVDRLRISGPRTRASGRASLATAPRDSANAISIDLAVERFDLRDLSTFLPGWAVSGALTANVSLAGPGLDRLSGDAGISLANARVAGQSVERARGTARFQEGSAAISLSAAGGGATASVDGAMRPLDRDPAYKFLVRLDRIPRTWATSPLWGRIAVSRAGPLLVRVTGHGYRPAVVELDGELGWGAGRISLTGGFRWAREPEWRVERLSLEEVDLDGREGPKPPTAVSATITASGRGFRPGYLKASASGRLAPSRFHGFPIDSGAWRLTIDGRDLVADARLSRGSESVDLETIRVRFNGKTTRFHVSGVRFRGIDLSAVTANAALASDLSGMGAFDGTIVATPRQPPDESGAVAISGEGRIVLSPSVLRRRVIRSGDVALRLSGAELDLSAELSSDAGDVRMSLEARPLGRGATCTLKEARFRNVDVAAWLGGAVPTRLSGQAVGVVRVEGAADGRLAGFHRVSSGRVELTLEPSTVGALRLPGGDGDVSIREDSVAARVDFSGAGGPIVLRADAVVGVAVPHGRVRVALPFSFFTRALGRDSLPADGGVDLDASIRGRDWRALTADLSLRGRGRVGAWNVDSVLAVLRLEDGALDVDSLGLRSNAAWIGASGRVLLTDSATGPPSAFLVHATIRDPAPLRPLLALDSLSFEGGEIEARLSGRPPRHQFDLTGSVTSLKWADAEARRGSVEVHGSLAADWRPTGFRGSTEVTHARWPPLTADLVRVEGTHQRRNSDLRIHARLGPSQDVTVAGRVSLDSSETRIRLDELVLHSEGAPWRLVRPSALRLGGSLVTVDSLEVRSAAGSIVAYGALGRPGDPGVELLARDVNLAFLSTWLGLEGDGVLNGRVRLTGTPSAPLAVAHARVDLRSAGRTDGTAESNARWDGRTARLSGSISTPKGDTLTVSGEIPFALSPAATTAGPTSVRVVAHQFPLADLGPLLPRRVVSRIQGTLDANVVLSADAGNRRSTGNLRVEHGVLGLPSLGVTYSDIDVRASASGDRLRLEQAHARSGKGHLDVDGSLRLADTPVLELDLRVRSRDFAFVSTPDLKVQASGEVRLAGNTREPRVSGALQASGFAYYATSAEVLGEGREPEIRLTDEDVQMMEDTFGYQKRSLPFIRKVYERADLDLRIALGRDNWLGTRASPRMALELNGDLRVRKQPYADPLVYGKISLASGRGYVETFGRTFDVTGGEITLDGPLSAYAADVRAEYRTRTRDEDVLVKLDVHSASLKTRLALSSEPPLSQTEITSYIATGRLPTGIGQQSERSGLSAGDLAADIGLARVSGQVGDLVQGKIGLDVLRVRHDPQVGATVVVGRYVDPRLYVGLRQPLQSRPRGGSQSQNPYGSSAEMEYEARSWLLLNLQGEYSLLRAFVRIRHAY